MKKIGAGFFAITLIFTCSSVYGATVDVKIKNEGTMKQKQVPVVISIAKIFTTFTGDKSLKVTTMDGKPLVYQWDDLDGNGVVSPADEIAFLIVLEPSEEKVVRVETGDFPVQQEKLKFKVKLDDKKAIVANDRIVYELRPMRSFSFPWTIFSVTRPGKGNSLCPDIIAGFNQPGAPGSINPVLLLSQGPVRIVIGTWGISYRANILELSRWSLFKDRDELLLELYDTNVKSTKTVEIGDWVFMPSPDPARREPEIMKVSQNELDTNRPKLSHGHIRILQDIWKRWFAWETADRLNTCFIRFMPESLELSQMAIKLRIEPGKFLKSVANIVPIGPEGKYNDGFSTTSWVGDIKINDKSWIDMQSDPQISNVGSTINLIAGKPVEIECSGITKDSDKSVSILEAEHEITDPVKIQYTEKNRFALDIPLTVSKGEKRLVISAFNKDKLPDYFFFSEINIVKNPSVSVDVPKDRFYKISEIVPVSLKIQGDIPAGAEITVSVDNPFEDKLYRRYVLSAQPEVKLQHIHRHAHERLTAEIVYAGKILDKAIGYINIPEETFVHPEVKTYHWQPSTHQTGYVISGFQISEQDGVAYNKERLEGQSNVWLNMDVDFFLGRGVRVGSWNYQYGGPDDPNFYDETCRIWLNKYGRQIVYSHIECPVGEAVGRAVDEDGWMFGGEKKPQFFHGMHGIGWNDPLTLEHLKIALEVGKDSIGSIMPELYGFKLIDFMEEGMWQMDRFLDFSVWTQDHFREWLWDMYGDETPAKDTNGDSRTMNLETKENFFSWSDIIPPKTSERTTRPGLHMLFHKYKGERIHWLLEAWPKKYGLTNFRNLSEWPSVQEYTANDAINLMLTGQNCHLFGYGWDILYDFHPLAIGLISYFDKVCRRNADKCIQLWFDPQGPPPEAQQGIGMILRRVANGIGRGTRVRVFNNQWGSNFETRDFNATSYPQLLNAQAWWTKTIEQQRWIWEGFRTRQPKIAMYLPYDAWLFSRYWKKNKDGTLDSDRQGGYIAQWIWPLFERNGWQFDIILPDEIENGELSQYDMLVLYNGEYFRPKVLEAIHEFSSQGGYVMGFGEVMRGDMYGDKPEVFESVFGAKIKEVLYNPIVSGFWNDLRNIAPQFGFYRITTSLPWLPTEGTELPSFQRLVTVTPTSAQVLATFKGEPCIVTKEHSLFIGTDMGHDMAFYLPSCYRWPILTSQMTFGDRIDSRTLSDIMKIVTGYLSQTPIEKVAWVEESGEPAFHCWAFWQENVSRNTGLLIVTENEHRGGSVTVHYPCISSNAVVVDIKNNKIVNYSANGKLEINIKPGSWNVFIVAPVDIAEEVMKIQSKVNQEARVMPWLGSQLFFYEHVRKSDNVYSHEIPVLRDRYQFLEAAPGDKNIEARPIARIVLPDKPTEEDIIFAKVFKHLSETMPIAEGKVIAGGVSFIRATELSEDDAKKFNLMIIGGPEENPWAKKAIESGKINLHSILQNQTIVTNENEAPYWNGGNVIVFIAPRGKRKESYEEFYKWMRIWWGYPLAPMPVEKNYEEVATKYGK